jgi:hypothetical protein
MNARFYSWFMFRPCFRGGRSFVCRAYVILSMLSAATSGCGRNQEAAPLPVAVQVATLTNETVACQVRFSAVVREWQQVDLSFKVPGTVKDLLQVPVAGASLRDVQEGDVVIADPKQPLARLDDSDYQRQRTAAAERCGAGSSQRAGGGRPPDGGGERLPPHQGVMRAEVGIPAVAGRSASSAGLDRSRAGRNPPRNRRGQRRSATSGRRSAELRPGHADSPGHDRPAARRAA